MSTWSARPADDPPQQTGMGAPSINLPKGGGGIREIGEKFAANPATGTGTISIPIALSPGRQGFGPSFALKYNSGSGNSPFGFGWQLDLPSISRKTESGLPLYADAQDSDTFVLSGTDDLVPEYRVDAQGKPVVVNGLFAVREDPVEGYMVRRYRPRIEGLFARVERWTLINDPRDVHWRSISPSNVLTIYGDTLDSRIADPAPSSARIFTWLVSEVRDDRGNAVIYRYKREDGAGVELASSCEANRGGLNAKERTANRYLKRIYYGNRAPLLDTEGKRPHRLDPDALEASIANGGWLFEAVFDYGEHTAEFPEPAELEEWKPRTDAFSSRRAGFEVRTMRLCRRVLMFHHFDAGSPGGGRNVLVRSTSFTHSAPPVSKNGPGPAYAFLTAATESGYRKVGATYLRRDLPKLELGYSEARVGEIVSSIDSDSLRNLPAGIDGATHRWVDLHGDGVAGVLTEQGGAWYYKRNLSPLYDRTVRFAPRTQVADRPDAGLAGGELMDLEGDGRPDLVVLDTPIPGFYEVSDGGWDRYRPFTSRPNVDFSASDLRFIDLDGDGRSDLLVTEDDRLVWYPSLGEEGFGPAHRVGTPLDEEMGPRLLRTGPLGAVHLADMTGDGLTDLVRVTEREVCYWPNLGHGRFGAKVTMDNAPNLGADGAFDSSRVVLADIDGSGTTDIIYLGADGIHLYSNRSGNGWSGPNTLSTSFRVDDSAKVAPIDLFGNGTACLVWSSQLDAEAGGSMRYIDLMKDGKPYLLTRVVNNLGAETTISYASSSYFYLKDMEAGRPWVTRLPFPVHVVSAIETYDRVSKTTFVSRFAFHDGFFDGDEREFRGFGFVEQWDTESYNAFAASGDPLTSNVDAKTHVPPIHTKTWFHTGAWLGKDEVPASFAGLLDAIDKSEWYAEPGQSATAVAEMLPADPDLPPDLKTGEWAEACRALKGALLRQEVYADDSSDRTEVPYWVSTSTFNVVRLQPRGQNRNGVFFVHPLESIGVNYERNPADPRINHKLSLEVDGFGNVLKSVSIGYGRRADLKVPAVGGGFETVPNPAFSDLQPWDRERQTQPLILCSDNLVTHPIDEDRDYRIPVLCDTRSYDLTRFVPTGRGGRYRAEDFALDDPLPADPYRQRLRFDNELSYHQRSTEPARRRLVEHVRTLFRSDDLERLLKLGSIGSLALPGESYRLALNQGLIANAFKRPRDGGLPDEAMVPDPATVLVGKAGDRGGYVPGEAMVVAALFPADDPAGHYWQPSGRTYFSFAHSDTPALERAFARSHFFLPWRTATPFDAVTSTEHDHYDLLPVSVRDPVGNTITAINDYRVLKPSEVADANGNRSAFRFDALGLVVGTAIMGKAGAVTPEGDGFDDFDDDANPDDVDDLIELADPFTVARTLLGGATTRCVYRIRSIPATTTIIARETHARDTDGNPSRLQLTYSHLDGLGREVSKKSLAEPGVVPLKAADGQIEIGGDGQPLMGTVAVWPRWVASGQKVYNNKGAIVRQFEPLFTDTQRYEPVSRVGVSPVMFYDPLQRLVGTLKPDRSWRKTVITAWATVEYDGIDTIAIDGSSPDGDPDIGDYIQRLPAGCYSPTWYALRTAPQHAARFAAIYPDPSERKKQTEAATRSAVNANTPTQTHLDVLGRAFLTIHDNGPDPNGAGDAHRFLPSRVELDIEGNQLSLRDSLTTTRDLAGVVTTDPLGRIVELASYDMIGNCLSELNMEAGGRWMLTDVLGNPIRAWNDRGHTKRTAYDANRRPTHSFVTGPDTAGREILVERLVYGEGLAAAQTRNLRGHLWLQLDQAGAAVGERFDFKGNPLAGSRRLLNGTQYRTTQDWSGLPDDPNQILNALAPRIELKVWNNRISYDALNRPTQVVAPHRGGGAAISVIQPAYNEANLLEALYVWLDLQAEPIALLSSSSATLTPVAAIEYNARGQRTTVVYGCGAHPAQPGVTTKLRYDPLTFLLSRLTTERNPADFPDDFPVNPASGWPGRGVQDLSYVYDPGANVTHVADGAQQTVYFRNRRVEPSASFRYDALYRLVFATGREHLGQAAQGDRFPIPHSYDDAGRIGIGASGMFAPTDGKAMGAYDEHYTYDDAGNLISLRHVGSDPTHSGWTRSFAATERSLIENGNPGFVWKPSNRLSLAATGSQPAQSFAHDRHGNMLSMPQLQRLVWNHLDQLTMTERRKVHDADADGLLHQGERTYYVYDGAGERIRKVTERADGTLKDERIYLGCVELYRRHAGNAAGLERETLHVADERGRIALIETRNAVDDGSLRRLVRYQFSNHLGSASLELDDRAHIISYEEYTPYGSTALQAVRNKTDAAKRYRFTGKERDEESGLSYHGSRYYAPWYARWISCDIEGASAGLNRYRYVMNAPTRLVDDTGNDGTPPKKELSWYEQAKIVGGFGFTIITGKTPDQALDALKDATIGPVMTIYAPGGMLDKAAQKGVDKAMGVQKPDEAYATKEESDKHLQAIVAVGGTLAPPLKVPGIGGIGPGPALATSEGLVVATATVTTTAKTTSVAVGPAIATGTLATGGGGGAGGKTGPKTPRKGSTGGGPGTWEDDLANGENMNADQRKYQEQQTGAKASRTYYVNDRSFDGFEKGVNGAKDKLIEAKHLPDTGNLHRLYTKFESGDFSEWRTLVDRGKSLLKQGQDQVRAAKGTGAIIEWRVSNQKMRDVLQMMFDNNNVTKGKINVVFRPLRPG